MQPFLQPIVAAPMVAPAPAPEPREVEFRFTGSAAEYFRIWIVNTLLSIVTLGIYSAWAKVRSKQYFYRHTWVDGASFEYLGDPIRILKGRLIIAAALGLLFASQYYSPILYGVLVAVALLVSPWVMVKSLAFNARNSAHRNVRFSFVATTTQAFGLMFGMTLLHLISCGLAYPHVQWRITKFVAEGHLYGDLPFGFRWTTSNKYYRLYLIALAMTLPIYGIAVLVAMGAAGSVQGGGFTTTTLIVFGIVYAALLIPAAYVRAGLANLFYDGLNVGDHTFHSTQSWKTLSWLYATNALGVIATAGLLIPWAKIRLASYRASCLTLYAVGDLEAEVLDLGDPNALGDAASDLGDFGIDIGA